MIDSYAYEHVGEFIKAMGHEKRLQIIKLLSTHERCVEDLATAMDVGVKSVSAHLKVMRTQGLLVTRKEGLRVYYRLRNNEILEIFEHVWQVASEGKSITPTRAPQFNLTLRELLALLDSPDTLLLDVRDADMFAEGHIPNALSVPIDDFRAWTECYQGKHAHIVVYCEGYYCFQALDAANILINRGLNVKMYTNGLDEWVTSGFDVEK